MARLSGNAETGRSWQRRAEEVHAEGQHKDYSAFQSDMGQVVSRWGWAVAGTNLQGPPVEAGPQLQDLDSQSCSYDLLQRPGGDSRPQRGCADSGEHTREGDLAQVQGVAHQPADTKPKGQRDPGCPKLQRCFQG